MLAEGNSRVGMLPATTFAVHAFCQAVIPSGSSVMSAANDGTQSRDLLFACTSEQQSLP